MITLAILRNRSNGICVVLNSYHIVGRSSSKADTIIDDKRVSQLHASFRFINGHWFILDHSRNGTKLNQQPLQHSKEVALCEMDQIDFVTADQGKWQIIDTSPPTNYLKGLLPEYGNIPLSSVTCLPNEDNPKATIYQLNNGQWVLSKDNIEAIICANGIVDLTPYGQWRLLEMAPLQVTQDQALEVTKFLDTATFHFFVSQDEEEVLLKINYQGNTFDLGVRAHHYLALLMARKRIEDAKASLPYHTQGWHYKDVLQKMMRIDPLYINLQIFRIKKQLSNIFGVELDIYEKKYGEIRIIPNNIVISKEGAEPVSSKASILGKHVPIKA